MTVPIVLGCVLAFLLILLLLPVTAEAELEQGRFSWAIRLGGVRILPKRKKQADDNREEKKDSPTKKKPSPEIIKGYANLFRSLFERYTKRLHWDTMRVHFLSAFDDPYDTAMVYSYVGIAMETVAGIADGNIRHLDLHTDLDFDKGEMEISASAKFKTRFFHVTTLALAALRGRRSLEKQLGVKENENAQSTDR